MCWAVCRLVVSSYRGDTNISDFVEHFVGAEIGYINAKENRGHKNVNFFLHSMLCIKWAKFVFATKHNSWILTFAISTSQILHMMYKSSSQGFRATFCLLSNTPPLLSVVMITSDRMCVRRNVVCKQGEQEKNSPQKLTYVLLDHRKKHASTNRVLRATKYQRR